MTALQQLADEAADCLICRWPPLFAYDFMRGVWDDLEHESFGELPEEMPEEWVAVYEEAMGVVL